MKFVFIFLGIIIFGFFAIQFYIMQEQKKIESYPYTVVEKFQSFEIRKYDAALFSSVKLSSSKYEEASSEGFTILASYIFGKNQRSQKISMTSPVSMSLADTITMMFMVPKSIQKENLPKPNQTQIEFKEEPEKKVAVIRFGGWANDEKIEMYKRKLILLLEKERIKHKSKFYFFGYNPPFELFNRKNEVVVELE